MRRKFLEPALGQSAARRSGAKSDVQRVCVAGGDTSSYAARALGIEALEMIASLMPGCAFVPGAGSGFPADGVEVNFKGGQVGPENYFEIVKRGKI